METASTPDSLPPERPSCPSCHGVGSVLMSLCCGRGCATCPGDGMLENVECHRCRGSGHLSAAHLD